MVQLSHCGTGSEYFYIKNNLVVWKIKCHHSFIFLKIILDFSFSRWLFETAYINKVIIITDAVAALCWLKPAVVTHHPYPLPSMNEHVSCTGVFCPCSDSPTPPPVRRLGSLEVPPRSVPQL